MKVIKTKVNLNIEQHVPHNNKYGGERSCSGRINSSCSTSDTYRAKARVSCVLVSFYPINGRSSAFKLAHILQYIPVPGENTCCVLVLSSRTFGSH